MEQHEQHVSTDAQRMALEAMSAQLVHKLNAMISEQEERARLFAEQHHSLLSVPQPVTPTAPVIPQPVPQSTDVTTAAPETAPTYIPVPPKPPQPPKEKAAPILTTAHSAPKVWTQKKKSPASKEEEGSNIGAGMIIFALAGLFLLLRSCS